MSVSPYSEFSSGDVGELLLIDGQLIPQVKFQDLASLSKEKIVIKIVLPKKESLTMKEPLKEHIKRDPGLKIFPLYDFVHCIEIRNRASPANSRAVYEI